MERDVSAVPAPQDLTRAARQQRQESEDLHTGQSREGRKPGENRPHGPGPIAVAAEVIRTGSQEADVLLQRKHLRCDRNSGKCREAINLLVRPTLRPCAFVRLTGCNLRCVWCDTAYAFEGGEEMEVDEILRQVALHRTDLVLVTYALALVINILGEELYMRGFILPRQILAHGRWAWLIHGVLWTLFHFPQRWTYLQILPITLALSYVTYRTRNTSIAMAAHYIGNGVLGMIPILLIVAGE